MSAVTATEADRSQKLDDFDQRIRLSSVAWADYERLLEIRGDRSVPRIHYLQGELQLMSPSARHEVVARMIGWLLGIWALECCVALYPFGSTTWRERGAERGAEADESYVVGGAAKPRPDLVVEVVVTSGGIDKLEVYRGLGVPEVWFWNAGRITVHVLRGEQYEAAARSMLFPELDLELLARLVERGRDQSRAARLFQRLLRRRRQA